VSFLLDTYVVSELSKPAPDANVERWLDEQLPESLFLSVPTVGEIEKGLGTLPAGTRRRALTAWLATLRGRYADRLLGIGEEIAILWGRLPPRQRRAGLAWRSSTGSSPRRHCTTGTRW
jgi:predicted nucleic acid-binding protein